MQLKACRSERKTTLLEHRRKVASYLPTVAVKLPSAHLETWSDPKKNKKRSCDLKLVVQ